MILVSLESKELLTLTEDPAGGKIYGRSTSTLNFKIQFSSHFIC